MQQMYTTFDKIPELEGIDIPHDMANAMAEESASLGEFVPLLLAQMYAGKTGRITLRKGLPGTVEIQANEREHIYRHEIAFCCIKGIPQLR